MDEKALLDLLADQIEYDDERGLKFRRIESSIAMTPDDPRRYRICPVPTSKGNSCPNKVTPGRPACHVHDPIGKNAMGLSGAYRKKMVTALLQAGFTRAEIVGR